MPLRKNSKHLSRTAPAANAVHLTLSERWMQTVPDSLIRSLMLKRRSLAPGSFPHRKSMHQFLIAARMDDSEIALNLSYLWASWQRWIEAQHDPDVIIVSAPVIRNMPLPGRKKNKWLDR